MSETLDRHRRPLLTLGGVRQRPLPAREDHSAIKMPADGPPIRSIRAKPAPAPRPDSSPPALPEVKPAKPSKAAAPQPPGKPLRFVHTPADAETINQAREAEWLTRKSAAVQIEERLRALCPKVFTREAGVVPLKIGVHQDLYELLDKEFSQKQILKFLVGWVRRPAYRAIANADRGLRYDLEGNPVSCNWNTGPKR